MPWAQGARGRAAKLAAAALESLASSPRRRAGGSSVHKARTCSVGCCSWVPSAGAWGAGSGAGAIVSRHGELGTGGGSGQGHRAVHVKRARSCATPERGAGAGTLRGGLGDQRVAGGMSELPCRCLAGRCGSCTPCHGRRARAADHPLKLSKLFSLAFFCRPTGRPMCRWVMQAWWAHCLCSMLGARGGYAYMAAGLGGCASLPIGHWTICLARLG